MLNACMYNIPYYIPRGEYQYAPGLNKFVFRFGYVARQCLAKRISIAMAGVRESAYRTTYARYGERRNVIIIFAFAMQMQKGK